MDLDSDVDSDEDEEEGEEEEEDDAEEEEEKEGETSGEGKTTKEAAAAMVVMLQRMIGNDALGRLTNMAQEVSDGKISLDDFQVGGRTAVAICEDSLAVTEPFAFMGKTFAS